MSKVLLVTGGSRGIGAAIARLGARDGYDVVVNYHSNKAAADAVVADVEAAGHKGLAVQADASTEAGVLSLFGAVDEAFGRLDAFANNAGVINPQMRLEDMPVDEMERIFTTNITGPFLCAREAVRRMSTKHGGRGGSMVISSSAAARLGGAHAFLPYAASKGAMDTFTKGLAEEVAAEGIRVNAIRPGLIYTDIHADAGSPDRVDTLSETVPMKRGGTAEEVAETVLWLMSDAASYVTGTLVDISGGR